MVACGDDCHRQCFTHELQLWGTLPEELRLYSEHFNVATRVMATGIQLACCEAAGLRSYAFLLSLRGSALLSFLLGQNYHPMVMTCNI